MKGRIIKSPAKPSKISKQLIKEAIKKVCVETKLNLKGGDI